MPNQTGSYLTVPPLKVNMADIHIYFFISLMESTRDRDIEMKKKNDTVVSSTCFSLLAEKSYFPVYLFTRPLMSRD